MNFNKGCLLNSHRQIEPELMRRLMNGSRIISLTKNYPEKTGFEFLNN